MNVRRNEPCPCGSGRKRKRCCGAPGGVAGPGEPAAGTRVTRLTAEQVEEVRRTLREMEGKPPADDDHCPLCALERKFRAG